MAPEWTPPEGYTLTRVPGHYVNRKGYGSDTLPAEPMQDGGWDIPTYLDPPFVWRVNDGYGQNASQEAKDAAAAGTPLAGWAPNVEIGSIRGSWVPDQYTLTKDDDPTLGTTEPATVLGRDLTPAEELDRLHAAIAYAEARIAEIGDAS